MREVPWDDRPPPNAPRLSFSIHVHRIRRGEKEFIRLLGPWKGTWLHWEEKRSTPCFGPEKGCPLCPDPHLVWEGYAPALLWTKRLEETTGKWVGTWKPVVMPILPELRDDLSALSLGVEGIVLEISRQKGPVGKHTWRILERTEHHLNDVAAKPFDVVPILYRMWRICQRPTAAQAIFLSDDRAAVEKPQTPESS